MWWLWVLGFHNACRMAQFLFQHLCARQCCFLCQSFRPHEFLSQNHFMWYWDFMTQPWIFLLLWIRVLPFSEGTNTHWKNATTIGEKHRNLGPWQEFEQLLWWGLPNSSLAWMNSPPSCCPSTLRDPSVSPWPAAHCPESGQCHPLRTGAPWSVHQCEMSIDLHSLHTAHVHHPAPLYDGQSQLYQCTKTTHWHYI